MLAATATAGPLHLDLGAVGQDQQRQVGGRGGQHDRALETLPHDHRQIAAVVEMRVREEHRVQRGRVVGEGRAVTLHVRGQPLEHAALDEHPSPVGGEEELGAGDRGGRSHEL